MRAVSPAGLCQPASGDFSAPLNGDALMAHPGLLERQPMGEVLSTS